MCTYYILFHTDFPDVQDAFLPGRFKLSFIFRKPVVNRSFSQLSFRGSLFLFRELVTQTLALLSCSCFPRLLTVLSLYCTRLYFPESPTSGGRFMLGAHPSTGRLPFKCSVATWVTGLTAAPGSHSQHAARAALPQHKQATTLSRPDSPPAQSR